MSNSIIFVICILIAIILFLIIYNMSIHNKVQYYKNINQQINNLSIIQDFMTVVGESSSVEEKIKKINDTLIEKYEIKYSTIVVFDGTQFIIKASNVEPKLWDSLKRLHEFEIFQDSIAKATPKYVTVNKEGERLPYQNSDFGRAKSAIFFPLYLDNVYIGYWLLESGVPHDFDDVDTTILDVIKNNIITVLKTVVHQKTLESIIRTDKFTGLKSAEFLYSTGKKQIDQFSLSTICMFEISNIDNINETKNRKTGDATITAVANFVKANISNEYIFVRYMGPKFVIAFCGVDMQSVYNFISDLKMKMITLQVPVVGSTSNEVVSPIYDFALSQYYKGTAIEEVLKKEENYLNSSSKQGNDIVCL